MSAHEQQLQDLITNFNRFTRGARRRVGRTSAATVGELRADARGRPAARSPTSAAHCPSLRALRARAPPGARRAAGDDRRRRTRGSPRPQPLLSKPRRAASSSSLAAPRRTSRARARPGSTTLPQLGQLSRCTSAGPGADRQPGDRRPLLHRPAELPRVLLHDRRASPARARTSTATAPTSASSRAAGDLTASESRSQRGPRRRTRRCGRTRSLPPLGHPAGFGPMPPYRPDVNCYTNAVPDLNAGLGGVGPPSPAPRATAAMSPRHRTTDRTGARSCGASSRSLGDFLAVCVLVIAGLAVTLVILSQQKAALPGWVPFFGQELLRARRPSSPGPGGDPGPGPGGDIAGIQVGKIDAVSLEDGHAVVGDGHRAQVRAADPPRRALLLRPKTGLNDMVVEMDPGSAAAAPGRVDDPARRGRRPNVNPDEILATLDADTRQYLTLLLQGGAEGIGGRRRAELSAGPAPASSRSPATSAQINRRARQAPRRRSRRSIHNFRPAHRGARPPATASWRGSSTPRTRRSAASPTSRPRSARRCASCRRPSTTTSAAPDERRRALAMSCARRSRR